MRSRAGTQKFRDGDATCVHMGFACFGGVFGFGRRGAKTHPVRPTDLLLTTGRADRIVVFDWSTPPKTLYTTTK